MAVDLVVSALDITSYIQIVPFQREKKTYIQMVCKTWLDIISGGNKKVILRCIEDRV